MKTYLFLALLLSSLLCGGDNHGPACTSSQFSFADDKRYFDIGLSISGYAKVDDRTIKIDRKNKTIKVWILTLASLKGREDIIRFLGKYEDYSQYGSSKELVLFDYKNMRQKSLKHTYFRCDGTPYDDSNGEMEWSDIVPGSMVEHTLEKIMQKYKL